MIREKHKELLKKEIDEIRSKHIGNIGNRPDLNAAFTKFADEIAEYIINKLNIPKD